MSAAASVAVRNSDLFVIAKPNFPFDHFRDATKLIVFRKQLELFVNKELNWNWKELSRQSGVPYNTLHSIKEGTNPRADTVYQIASAFELSFEWLMAGRGPMHLDETTVHSPLDRSQVIVSDVDLENDRSGAYTMIPRYDVGASAGHGMTVNDEDVLDYTPFRTDWLRGMNLQREHLSLIYVEGDSMQPTLQPGDTLLVDTRRDGALKTNAVYVIRIRDCLLVKRLQIMLSGAIRVMSDNPQYVAEVVEPGMLDQLSVVGRVVWAGKRM